MLSGADQEVVDLLGKFGLALGYAYQLTDDLLDYSDQPTTTGKSVGKDFALGIWTLPVIRGVDRGVLKHTWHQDLTFEEARDLLWTEGILEDIKQEAQLCRTSPGDSAMFERSASSWETCKIHLEPPLLADDFEQISAAGMLRSIRGVHEPTDGNRKALLASFDRSIHGHASMTTWWKYGWGSASIFFYCFGGYTPCG